MTHNLADQLREIDTLLSAIHHGAPIDSYNRVRVACDRLPSLIEAVAALEAQRRERKVAFTCERTGKRWEFETSAHLAEAFLKSQAEMEADTFDYFRVREWALSKPRKPAATAFTASTNRDVASLIEEVEAQACPSGVGVDDLGIAIGKLIEQYLLTDVIQTDKAIMGVYGLGRQIARTFSSRLSPSKEAVSEDITVPIIANAIGEQLTYDDAYMRALLVCNHLNSAGYGIYRRDKGNE